MIFITGDTHGNMDRFSYRNWPQAKGLSSQDIVIVTGDFGLLFNNEATEEELYWKAWLTSKPWLTLFVCGNHENFPRLAALPVKELFGGLVGEVAPNILHLKRGEIYTIQGKKFFVFGGADSVDKSIRTPGVSWWPEELPSSSEINHALDNLEKHQYAVDYILAHTAPQDIASEFFRRYGSLMYNPDPTRIFLQHVCSSCSFEGFYCGHWHEEWTYGKYHILYEQIYRLL